MLSEGRQLIRKRDPKKNGTRMGSEEANWNEERTPTRWGSHNRGEEVA